MKWKELFGLRGRSLEALAFPVTAMLLAFSPRGDDRVILQVFGQDSQLRWSWYGWRY